ncbi:MAG: tRNA dihydrouridine synthase DusB [Firmicutes bacterium]|nr:tRNA dihydrouridine synthase DusB [Bacillota bacterium]
MAGITDLPFRILAREYGADLAVSEMVSAQALIYENQRTLRMLTIAEQERPVAIQIFGHDGAVMAEAAKIVYHSVAPEMIDLNFGCPTPKIVKNGDGSALMKSPKLLAKIASAVVEAVPIPVTAKIRLGWDQTSINCVDVARMLEDAGVHWITVHGRTREQFYSGEANWDWIRKIKEATTIPIVGNGDVFSFQDATDLLNQTGCDHVAIGRGARGNPWIFNQIKVWLNEGVVLPDPTVEERISLALRHLKMKVDYDGEEKAVREMRPHLAWYLKGVPFSAEVRKLINTTTTLTDMELLLKELL